MIHVPFLNLLSNIAQRTGHVNVRINRSTLYHSTLITDLGPETNAILYDPVSSEFKQKMLRSPLVHKAHTRFHHRFHLHARQHLLPRQHQMVPRYALSSFAQLVITRYTPTGIPFGDTTTHRHLAMAAYSQSILGDNLAGLLVGLYSLTGRRPYNYSPGDYSLEFGQLATAMQDATPIDDSSAVSSNNAHNKASTLLIGPNIISGASGWTPEQVCYTGFVDVHKDNLAALSVQQYRGFLHPPATLPTTLPSDCHCRLLS